MSDRRRQSEVLADNKEKLKTREPDMYKVILHNDHYTTQQFVVELLMFLFHKSEDEAIATMLAVHHKGSGIAGIYTYDIAKTKAMEAERLAREQEFPLMCTLEKA
ncbi:MAG: ATP-dependent Clp protease adaptor ClpS [Spirochaetales bacterium]|jgi:ATP-dependent Clp protease adaptor protein ClpS|nr:ATP-dependent Clp protease adaptor ClpS [Spirochaetales bacterium]